MTKRDKMTKKNQFDMKGNQKHMPTRGLPLPLPKSWACDVLQWQLKVYSRMSEWSQNCPNVIPITRELHIKMTKFQKLIFWGTFFTSYSAVILFFPEEWVCVRSLCKCPLRAFLGRESRKPHWMYSSMTSCTKTYWHWEKENSIRIIW